MHSLKLTLGTLVFVSGLALAQHRGPPAEALAACSGLSTGTACAFTHEGRNLTGTCRAGPQGEALACAPAGGPHGHGPRTPPPEAIAACQAQADGASCSFTIDGRAVTGTCGTPPDGAALACRPQRPEGERRGPPQEALTACASLSVGASCTVTFHGQAVIGSCVAGPQGEALACLPPRP